MYVADGGVWSNRSVRWSGSENEHGQKAARRTKQQRGKHARMDRARFGNGNLFHDALRIEARDRAAVSERKIPPKKKSYFQARL